MTSFSFGKLSAKDRASGRLLMQFHRAIAVAFEAQRRARGLTQLSVAEALSVNKSVVSRILSGRGNPTLRTIAELAWAMGFRVKIIFEPIEPMPQNATSAPVMLDQAKPVPKTPLFSQKPSNTAKVQIAKRTSELTDA